MFKKSASLAALVLWCGSLSAAEPAKVRLFILSGQSNMAGLNPDLSFTPAVKAAFPNDDVIVVKSAQGGQPIRQWLKDWKAPAGASIKSDPASQGKLYTALMAAVKKATQGKKVDAVCFVWMQGERDAREKLSAVYEDGLRDLVKLLRDDLAKPDMSVVIGRLSDFAKDEHWQAVRAAQVKFAEKEPRGRWVDTDDLNGAKDDLHYDKAGYLELGRRFAAKGIELMKAEK